MDLFVFVFGHHNRRIVYIPRTAERTCGFWFLICNAATQLALQLQHERTRVVHRN